MSAPTIETPRRPRLGVTANITIAVLLVAVIVVIAFPTTFYPFGRDQAIHAYIAKLVNDGYAVYRDVFNVKPPLTTVIHSLSQSLFGETMRSIRFLDVLLVGAAGVMLQMLVTRHLYSVSAGIVAAIAYATFYFSNDYWTTAQTDGWCGIFLIGAMLAYSHALENRSGIGRIILLAIAGCALGLSFWLKYTSASALLVFPAVHLASGIRGRALIVDAATVAAAFLGTIGLGLAILAAQGSLIAFLDIQDFMRDYVSNSVPLLQSLATPLLIMNVAKAATAFAMLGIYVSIKSLKNPEFRVSCIGLLVWLAAGYLSGVLQGKGFKYHFLPLYPALAIAVAAGVFALTSRIARSAGSNLAKASIVVACAVIVLVSQVPRNYGQVLPVLREELSLRDHWMNPRFGHERHNMLENMAVADYLKGQLLPCDRVYIWGFQPSIYFLSDRHVTTRFIFNFPMFTAFYRQAYRDEFISGLRAAPPSVFIVEHGDRSPHVSIHNNDSAEVMERYDALKQFVTTTYTFRERINRFDIYFRNDIAPDAARSCPPSTSPH